MSSKAKIKSGKEDSKPALVPKLRFPEFRGTEGWEVRKLSSAVQLVSGMHLSPEHYGKEGVVPYFTGPSDFTNDIGSITKRTNHSTSLARENDTLITVKGSGVGEIWYLTLSSVALGRQLMAVRAINAASRFIFDVLLTKRPRFEDLAAGNLIPGLSRGDILDLETSFPDLAEQQKIAGCLSSLDELIAAQARKVDALKAHKKGLMQQLFPREGETQPRLRFPELQDDEEWQESTVDEIIGTVTPPKKLPTSEYGAEGGIPIIDQSKDYICGWTNDHQAVIDKRLPVIVFGDHTCTLKFVDRPFAQGADGIKIIRPKRGIDVRFLFCALEANPVVQESYKRHFSMLREKKLSFPDQKSGEQQRIANCLSSLDATIASETQKLDALKLHKKGLMQQLFPSPEGVS